LRKGWVKRIGFKQRERLTGVNKRFLNCSHDLKGIPCTAEKLVAPRRGASRYLPSQSPQQNAKKELQVQQTLCEAARRQRRPSSTASIRRASHLQKNVRQQAISNESKHAMVHRLLFHLAEWKSRLWNTKSFPRIGCFTCLVILFVSFAAQGAGFDSVLLTQAVNPCSIQCVLRFTACMG